MSDPPCTPTIRPGGCPAIKRVMMPRDTNAFGTIFGGVILSEIDLAAAVEAHKSHSGKMLTVAMDEIVFRAIEGFEPPKVEELDEELAASADGGD